MWLSHFRSWEMVVPRNLNDSTAVTVLFMMVSGGRAGGFQTCQPVRILRSGHAFWPQSTQVRFVILNYAKTWWRLCARTVAYLNHATATKEDFDQSERWVHSPSNMWDDWQMRNVRPIIKKRLQIDSKTKSRSVSRLFTPAVWFLKRGQYTHSYSARSAAVYLCLFVFI